MICVALPIRIISEANQRGHWAKSAGRKALHRRTASAILQRHARPTAEKITITLTRFAPRRLDSDNLQFGFKAVRDGVADWLGIDDGSPRLTWAYADKRGEFGGDYLAEVVVSWDD